MSMSSPSSCRGHTPRPPPLEECAVFVHLAQLENDNRAQCFVDTCWTCDQKARLS